MAEDGVSPEVQEETFRNREILFLQEQNNQVLETLERVERERDQAYHVVKEWTEKDADTRAEHQKLQNGVNLLQTELNKDREELASKDEHIRVLSEQNKQMLDLLETEEKDGAERQEKISVLQEQVEKLRIIADEFDGVKKQIDELVSEKKNAVAKLADEVRCQRQLNETLRADLQATEAQAKVDIEALEQALQVVNQKNLEYLHHIGTQEVAEQNLNAELEQLKETKQKLFSEIQGLKEVMDGDEDERQKFERNKGDLHQRIESVEAQVDALKKALNSAERANEQLQEENRKSAEKFREVADKVYALMDSLRLNQVEVKKQEAENAAKEKKLQSLEKQAFQVQAKVTQELEARQLAESDKKDSEQEAQLLKRKNKKIEESIAMAQKAQEKCERQIQELNERVNALQTQNAYLASRIDGQEEEKNALKAELKKGGDRLTEVTHNCDTLRDSIEKSDQRVAGAKGDKAQLVGELEYIKREDALDEDGRQRPVLIETSESRLLEQLNINEYIYQAQQHRNPVPPLVEKLAQLLELLHAAQSQADQYLGDLSKSNGLVSALRQKNIVLFERTQMFETFKTRALIRYVMNLIEAGECSFLYLDSLSFSNREVNEMLGMIARYNVEQKIFSCSLASNGLKDDCVNLILQMCFTLPYLRALDLRRNNFSNEAVRAIEEQIRSMPGVTGVVRDNNTGTINIHSGNQLRMAVEMGEQGFGSRRDDEKENLAPGITDMELPGKDVPLSSLAHTQADEYLASPAGFAQPAQTGYQFPQQSQIAAPDPGSVNRPGPGFGGPMAGPPGVQGAPPGSQGYPGQGSPGTPQGGLPRVGGGPRASNAGGGAGGGAKAPGAAGPGGVPVGLGGPGDVAQLGRKQAARRKVAPPAPVKLVLPAMRDLKSIHTKPLQSTGQFGKLGDGLSVGGLGGLRPGSEDQARRQTGSLRMSLQCTASRSSSAPSLHGLREMGMPLRKSMHY